MQGRPLLLPRPHGLPASVFTTNAGKCELLIASGGAHLRRLRIEPKIAGKSSVSEEPRADRFLRRRQFPVICRPMEGAGGHRRAFQNGWLSGRPNGEGSVHQRCRSLGWQTVLIVLLDALEHDFDRLADLAAAQDEQAALTCPRPLRVRESA